MLEALESDFSQFAMQLEDAASANEEKMVAIRWLLERTGPDAAPMSDLDEFADVVAASMRTSAPEREVGALRELLAGPGLALLDDAELRSRLTWWVQNDVELDQAAHFTWDFAVDYRR